VFGSLGLIEGYEYVDRAGESSLTFYHPSVHHYKFITRNSSPEIHHRKVITTDPLQNHIVSKLEPSPSDG
jgi:hypothetical protein